MIDLALYWDFASEAFNYLLANVQAESDPTRVYATRRTELAKKFEKFGLISLWNPNTGITHADLKHLSLLLERHKNNDPALTEFCSKFSSTYLILYSSVFNVWGTDASTTT